MDIATLSRMGHLGDELLALLRQQMGAEPDCHLVEFVWRDVFAVMLAGMIRHGRMAPAEMEVYLERICAELRTTTAAVVREGDLAGWERLDDAE